MWEVLTWEAAENGIPCSRTSKPDVSSTIPLGASDVAMSARFVSTWNRGRGPTRQKLRSIRREDRRTRTEPVPSLLVATPSLLTGFRARLNPRHTTQHRSSRCLYRIFRPINLLNDIHAWLRSNRLFRIEAQQARVSGPHATRQIYGRQVMLCLACSASIY